MLVAMCGFVGLVTSDRRNLPEDPVGAALAVLAPRGPDGAGRARVPVGARSLELGVRRLALVDPERGRQPLTRPSGAVLAFNGEVYNHERLRAELVAKGQAFATQND